MDYLHSPNFTSHLEKLMQKYHVPGVSIAVTEGEREFSAGYGFASLEPSRPCTVETIFDIASSSKSLTAASVGLLVRNDAKYPEVKYESLMSSLLPDDFVMQGKGYTDSVTVEDILSHRTGLPIHDDSYLGLRAKRPDTAESVTRNLRNLAPTAPVRTKYMYNNLMYTVATHLVEKKSGLPFADFLQEHFFEPLGMSSTHLQPARVRAAGRGDQLARGHEWDEKNQRYISFEAQDCPESQGAGSIMTTASDYLKWVKALMNQEHPIDEEVYKGLVRMRTFPSPDGDDLDPFTSPIFYATGLEVFYYRGHTVIGHDGSISGFGSRHFFVPSLRLGCVMFGNGEGACDLVTVLSRELLDEALAVPTAERPDWDALTFGRIQKYDEFPEQKELQRVLREDTEPQKMPLAAYTGEYWNPGYHGMIVEVKNGKLFIDATDRSSGFTLVFDHVRGQTEYIIHLSNYETGGDELFHAQFLFEGNKTAKLGLKIAVEDFIWFDRVDDP